jgi:hypothetical protein
MRAFGLIVAVVAIGGCAGPAAIDEARVYSDIAQHYRDFFPVANDPDPNRDAGLLRPRFGIPAFAKVGDPFSIELFERGGSPTVRAALLRHDLGVEEGQGCLRGTICDGCYPLEVAERTRQWAAHGATVARFDARPQSAPPAGGYDLALDSGVDAPVRVPRAVWLSDGDPLAPRPISIAHFSDPHVGKTQEPHLEERLKQVIADIEEGHPDLVVLTGDVVHRGSDGRMHPHAVALLSTLNAPLIIINGNHDLGFGRPDELTRYFPGWPFFARAFHPYLFFQFVYAGWEFVGFDTGPSVFTPRVLTRGLSKETLERIRGIVEQAYLDQRQGVILFGHAPTRANFFTTSPVESPGILGQMRDGARELEKIILDGAGRGQKIFHLAGHTHWAQLFESRVGKKQIEYARAPSLPGCPRAITGKAAQIVAQSATRSGLTDSGRGWGYDWLHLGEVPRVGFRRFGIELPLCEER